MIVFQEDAIAFHSKRLYNLTVWHLKIKKSQYENTSSTQPITTKAHGSQGILAAYRSNNGFYCRGSE